MPRAQCQGVVAEARRIEVLCDFDKIKCVNMELTEAALQYFKVAALALASGDMDSTAFIDGLPLGKKTAATRSGARAADVTPRESRLSKTVLVCEVYGRGWA